MKLALPHPHPHPHTHTQRGRHTLRQRLQGGVQRFVGRLLPPHSQSHAHASARDGAACVQTPGPHAQRQGEDGGEGQGTRRLTEEGGRPAVGKGGQVRAGMGIGAGAGAGADVAEGIASERRNGRTESSPCPCPRIAAAEQTDTPAATSAAAALATSSASASASECKHPIEDAPPSAVNANASVTAELAARTDRAGQSPSARPFKIRRVKPPVWDGGAQETGEGSAAACGLNRARTIATSSPARRGVGGAAGGAAPLSLSLALPVTSTATATAIVAEPEREAEPAPAVGLGLGLGLGRDLGAGAGVDARGDEPAHDTSSYVDIPDMLSLSYTESDTDSDSASDAHSDSSEDPPPADLRVRPASVADFGSSSSSSSASSSALTFDATFESEFNWVPSCPSSGYLERFTPRLDDICEIGSVAESVGAQSQGEGGVDADADLAELSGGEHEEEEEAETSAEAEAGWTAEPEFEFYFQSCLRASRIESQSQVRSCGAAEERPAAPGWASRDSASSTSPSNAQGWTTPVGSSPAHDFEQSYTPDFDDWSVASSAATTWSGSAGEASEVKADAQDEIKHKDKDGEVFAFGAVDKGGDRDSGGSAMSLGTEEEGGDDEGQIESLAEADQESKRQNNGGAASLNTAPPEEGSKALRRRPTFGATGKTLSAQCGLNVTQAPAPKIKDEDEDARQTTSAHFESEERDKEHAHAHDLDLWNAYFSESRAIEVSVSRSASASASASNADADANANRHTDSGSELGLGLGRPSLPLPLPERCAPRRAFSQSDAERARRQKRQGGIFPLPMPLLLPPPTSTEDIGEGSTTATAAPRTGAAIARSHTLAVAHRPHVNTSRTSVPPTPAPSPVSGGAETPPGERAALTGRSRCRTGMDLARGAAAPLALGSGQSEHRPKLGVRPGLSPSPAAESAPLSQPRSPRSTASPSPSALSASSVSSRPSLSLARCGPSLARSFGLPSPALAVPPVRFRTFDADAEEDGAARESANRNGNGNGWEVDGRMYRNGEAGMGVWVSVEVEVVVE